MSIETQQSSEKIKNPEQIENSDKLKKGPEGKDWYSEDKTDKKIERQTKLDSYKTVLSSFGKELESINLEKDKEKKMQDFALLYVGVDSYQKEISNIALKVPKINSTFNEGEKIDSFCEDFKDKIMENSGDKVKLNEIVSKLFDKISNKDFLKYTAKDQRLEKITKPPKEAKDVKSGDDIRFTFTFEDKLNENLYLKTTAGQVLPGEIRAVESDGVQYSRDSIGGEFFTTNNERLLIHEGTQIKIGKIGTSEEMTKMSKENDLKVAEYLKQNPNSDSKIVSESINRGIDPKIAVMTFSDLIKGKTDQNEIDAVLEDVFTEFDRTRGNYNVDSKEVADKGSVNGSEFIIMLLSKFLGNNWKTKAKEYGISDENIKLSETNGAVNMGMKSEDIKNADNLQDGGYLKGRKLLDNPAFSKKLDEVSNSIGANRDDLIKIMMAESTLDPRIINPYSNATGLIQFMPNTAKGLGTSVGKIRGMNGVEQLDLVEKYFKQNSKGYPLDSIEKLYQVVFYPYSLNKSPDFVFGSQDGKANIIKSQNKVISKFSSRPDGLIDGYAFSRYVQDHVSKLSNIA